MILKIHRRLKCVCLRFRQRGLRRRCARQAAARPLQTMNNNKCSERPQKLYCEGSAYWKRDTLPCFNPRCRRSPLPLFHARPFLAQRRFRPQVTRIIFFSSSPRLTSYATKRQGSVTKQSLPSVTVTRQAFLHFWHPFIRNATRPIVVNLIYSDFVFFIIG